MQSGGSHLPASQYHTLHGAQSIGDRSSADEAGRQQVEGQRELAGDLGLVALDIAEPSQLLAAAVDLELPEWVAATEHAPVVVKGMAEEVAVWALSPDQAMLRRKSRSRSANALLAVVEGITRPMRTWSLTN